MGKEKISILFPEDIEASYKMLSDTACHDLGLDFICSKLNSKPSEQRPLMNIMAQMTDSAEVARFRSDVFDDIYNYPAMRERLMELLDHVKFFKDYGSFKKDFDTRTSLWELLHRLGELKDYIETVEAIMECLSDENIKSKGLVKLRDYITAIYNDNAYKEMKKDIEELRADTSNLKSITVGINLNPSFEAESVGLVSVNNKVFKSSGILGNFAEAISTKEGVKNGNDWNGEYRYHPISRQGAGGVLETAEKLGSFMSLHATPVVGPAMAATVAGIPDGDGTGQITHYFDKEVSQLLSHVTKKLAKLIGKYVNISINEIVALIPELFYYTSWAEYIRFLVDSGRTFCKSKAYESMEDGLRMKARGIYNLKLVSAEEDVSIVPNDLDFGDDSTVYILTGANRGGKTTITQAVGLLYVLAQGGIYVPGESFEYVPVDCIFTHYPADEDKTMDLGRLGEECIRFGKLFDECTEKSLLLLNETFSTTSFEEGYYIARDAVRAIISKGSRTIYNTHMHKLAVEIDTLNAESEKYKAASLVVKSEEGKRSFKVVRTAPEGMSYAKDIAEKYGVTYEMLTKKK